MKKAIALFLSVFYLLFSFGSLRAEASLLENLENKETQENIFSVKQSEESSVNHFAETPFPKKQASDTFRNNTPAAVPVYSPSHTARVPLFLRNCNFRR